jgi:hypothetical protein
VEDIVFEGLSEMESIMICRWQSETRSGGDNNTSTNKACTVHITIDLENKNEMLISGEHAHIIYIYMKRQQQLATGKYSFGQASR